MKHVAKRKSLLALLFICLCLVLSCAFVVHGNFRQEAAAETTDLMFTLNSDKTGYRVRARNRTATEIVIPETYNDLPVTEVMDNGFSSCSNLMYIYIPKSVTRIGRNAFLNCKNLAKVNGMSRVGEIDAYAFSGCEALDNLIIPSTLEEVGNGIIKGLSNKVYVRSTEAEMAQLNSAWTQDTSAVILYGDEIACDPIYEGDLLIGFSVNQEQNLIYPDQDFTLIASYRGTPEEQALEDKSGLKHYPILQISDSAFVYCEFKSFALVSDPDIAPEFAGYEIYLGPYAFSNMYAETISIDVNIRVDSDSKGVFSNLATTQVISISDEIDIVPESAFAIDTVLETIQFGDNEPNVFPDAVTHIGAFAFDSCTMESVTFPGNIVHIDEYAFFLWGTENSQSVHFGMTDPGQNWSTEWNAETGELFTVEFAADQTEYTVQFDKAGGSGGTDSVLALRGQSMPAATAPSRDYYYFKGYFAEANGQGTQYYDENMNSVANWDKPENSTLYAYWEPYSFAVTLDAQGGTNGTEQVTVQYEQPLPAATAPQKDGNTFAGYYSEPNGQGIQYYDADMSPVHAWDTPAGGTLYANWTHNTYTVILDRQGGEGGIYILTATFDEAMPSATAPTKTGYEFKGYYSEQNGQGNQYYDAAMTSTSFWNIPSDEVVLYAYWEACAYNVVLDVQGGNGGTEQVEARYEMAMPSGIAPEKTGYTFGGYFTEQNGEGDQYYNANMVSTHNWEFADGGTLYAYWVPNEYVVDFDKAGGSGGSTYVIATFGEAMPAAEKPERTGFRFEGYYIEVDGAKRYYYNENMTSVGAWNIAGKTTLYADWSAKEFNVGFETYGGTSLKSQKVTFGEDMPIDLTPPTRDGYTFHGFFREADGKGTQYYAADMSSVHIWDQAPENDDEEITIYAYWTPNTYYVELDPNEGQGGSRSVFVVFGADMPEASMVAPTRLGYTFQGYFSEQNAGGECYYDGDMNSAYVWNIPHDATLYARWELNTYRITYTVNDPDGLLGDYTNPNPVEFSIEDFSPETMRLDLQPIISNGYIVTWEVAYIDTLGSIEINSTTPTPITYTITYDLNGGISNGDNPATFTVEDHVVLQDAVHETLFFDGWTWNGSPIEDLDGIMENITLVAQWTPYRTIYVTEDMTDLEITDPYVRLIFEDESTAFYDIGIASTVENVIIEGGGNLYNAHIDIKSRSTPFDLTLINIELVGDLMPTIEMNSTEPLNLYTKQTVKIIGGYESQTLLPGYGASGNYAISCGTLIINSADQLIIQGGNGEDAINTSDGIGHPGGDGAPAIIVDLDVYILCSNVTIIAGTAGDGSDGYPAGDGGAGAMPIVGKSEESKLYILEGVTDVVLYASKDGENGEYIIGGGSGGTIDPIPGGGDGGEGGIELPDPGDLVVPPGWDPDIPTIPPDWEIGLPDPPYNPPIYS